MDPITHTESFPVKTAAFEGPLELLLELVEKRKLLINDISLAEVTDEYMARVSSMQAQSLPGTAQFIQFAATLLLIKSKSLLPVLELTREEEEVIDDLEVRLKRYARYRELAHEIESIFGKTILHERQFTPDQTPLFVTDQYTTLESLATSINEVLQNLPRKEIRPKVQIRSAISLEEMITRLDRRIRSEMNLRFSDLLENKQEKTIVIVGFLAVLESVKQGSILVMQAERFADIELSIERASTPRYY